MPLFELRTKLPYDPNVFDKMKATAIRLLDNAEKEQNTQAIVLYSASKNEYSAIIKNACSRELTEEKALLEKLKIANDTEIRYVLCMWKNNEIDIPSFAFRKMMIELETKNTESLIFVLTADGVSSIKLSTTMK